MSERPDFEAWGRAAQRMGEAFRAAAVSAARAGALIGEAFAGAFRLSPRRRLVVTMDDGVTREVWR